MEKNRPPEGLRVEPISIILAPFPTCRPSGVGTFNFQIDPNDWMAVPTTTKRTQIRAYLFCLMNSFRQYSVRNKGSSLHLTVSIAASSSFFFGRIVRLGS